jgi:hypothetical protein
MQPGGPVGRCLSEPIGEVIMIRTLLLLIALLIIIAIALVATGAVNVFQRSDGTVAIQPKGVDIGSSTTNVSVPVVRMEDKQVSVPNVAVTNGQGNAQ